MRFKNTMTSEGAYACLSDRLPDFIFGTYHLMPGYITNTTRAIGHKEVVAFLDGVFGENGWDSRSRRRLRGKSDGSRT